MVFQGVFGEKRRWWLMSFVRFWIFSQNSISQSHQGLYSSLLASISQWLCSDWATAHAVRHQFHRHFGGIATLDFFSFKNNWYYSVHSYLIIGVEFCMRRVQKWGGCGITCVRNGVEMKQKRNDTSNVHSVGVIEGQCERGDMIALCWVSCNVIWECTETKRKIWRWQKADGRFNQSTAKISAKMLSSREVMWCIANK